MKYTRAALGLLNAQYRSVLKKCFLINLGLFALGAGISTADAAVTLSPTLDGLKTEAQKTGAVSSDAYTLTKLTDGATVPEGQAAVKIGGSVYYFSPNDGENAKFLSILAGTSAASLDNAANPTTISFNANNIPASVFSYAEGDVTDHNFVVQEAGQDGNITKKYYKIVLNTDKLSTSGGIAWSEVDNGSTTGNIKINLPNENTPTKLYYTVDESKYDKVKKNEGDRFTDLIGDVGSATEKFLFKDLKQTSDSSSVYGGAIHNSSNNGYNIYADFIGNYVYAEYSYGGAIYNGRTLGNITGNFIGNYASSSSSSVAYGGAINNSYGSTIGDITGNFIGNYASASSSSFSSSAAYGGAIDNRGTIGDITGDFIGNYASSSRGSACGGAIYNEGTIGDITGDFIGNYTSSSYSTYGGAIYNKGTLGNITGDFIGNYTFDGGVIYNGRDRTIGNITGNFIGNYASSSSNSYYSFSSGGAIYNYGTLGNITGDFIGNHTSISSSGNGIRAEGGAIYNGYGSTTIGNITGDFIGNYVSVSSSGDWGYAQGGAIYNGQYSTIGDITGNFIGNYASISSSGNEFYAQGGAIFNEGTLTIAGDSTFTDNYVEVNNNKTSNAIHNEKIVNFNGTDIVVNDAITGKNGTINIESSSNGMTTFNNTVSGNTVNLKQGTLKLGHYESALLGKKYVGTLGDGVDFNVTGGKLTTQDGATNDHKLGNLKLSANLNTSIDVDLNAKTGDKLTGSTDATSTGGSKILIDNIKVLADGTNHIVKIQVADEKLKDVMDLANGV